MSYRPGDVIEYRATGGLTRYVEIDEWEDDVKNGQPGFGGVVVSGPEKGLSVWGYADQIVRLYARKGA